MVKVSRGPRVANWMALEDVSLLGPGLLNISVNG